jgi:uncharacterized LabA/DUF88 family protein
MTSELDSMFNTASSPNQHAGEGAPSFSGLRLVHSTAVLLDGGFVRKRFAHLAGRRMTASEVLPLALSLLDSHTEDLFRVYFYDCAPSDRTTTHPISREPVALGTTAAFRENTAFQSSLAKTDQIALRKGDLVFRGWRLSRRTTLDLIQNGPRALANDDVEMNFTQKGIDVKIGLDVAWLSTKRNVDRIVLCTGDRDFVPAMKLARREGVLVALATLGASVHPTLLEHADFVRTDPAPSPTQRDSDR